MRIQFCGADRTVTGTCHLLEINGLRIFLDMGMYQGRREESRRLNQWLPDDARTAHAIILTHGHLDHCGKLPVVVLAGYKGPIYCTPATAEVARVVLEDSGQIQEEDAFYLNRRDRRPDEPSIQPLYRRVDVPAVLRQFRHVNYAQKIDLGNDVFFTLYDAGHILGSAYVVVEWLENGRAHSLLFTADVGRYGTPIIGDPHSLPGPVDHVITESTYGTVSHGPVSAIEPDFLNAIKYCVEHRSRLIIPSFAVGRTQSMLWYIQKFIKAGAIPSMPIFVDSPMGVEVSHAYQNFREYYDAETIKLLGHNDLFGLSRVTFASSTQQSKQINSQHGPCIIIASSPTCEFGRVLHHIVESVERPNDMILFVGWIPPYTLGRRLQDGDRRVRIYNRFYDVQCQIRTLHGMSAHADGDEILRFLAPTLRPETSVYVVHGEPDRAEGFAQRLLQAGAGRAEIPAMESAIITN